jgi:hypothetical protein
MGAILVLGRDEDLCCRLVREELLKTGCEVWFLREDQLLPDLKFTWMPSSTDRQGVMDYKDGRINFANVSGVLYRFYGIPVGPEDFNTRDGQYISAEWNALLMAWLHQLPCTVVNRLRPELWYKPHLNIPDLISLVPGLRFKLPRVLVTSASADARAFCRSVSGPVRYSPLTQPARYHIETEADIENLAALEGSLPLYLTEWIAGKALDAFVVDREVILVQSGGQIANETSAEVDTYCAQIGKSLGLGFYRLSLVMTTDGDWYCFGLDRVPQLYRCTLETQTRIARCLAHILSDGGRL